MHAPASLPAPLRKGETPPAARPRLFAALALGLFSAGLARAQDDPPAPAPLRVAEVMPGGVRGTATEAWGAYAFTLTNLSGSDRSARVLVFYEGQPDLQYGRDLWVPARSSLSSWLLAGPAPAQSYRQAREVQFLLYDRSEGADRLILPPEERRQRGRAVRYRPRAPSTAILLDEPPPDTPVDHRGALPPPESADSESRTLARTFRHAANLSEHVRLIPPGPLPPSAEAFDGTDHVILASGRLARDPAGLLALRRWLEAGGTVWVMLDRVDPEALAPLLGDALDFRVVDRVGLTRFALDRPGSGEAGAPQEHEKPVDFVRVLLPAGERPRHTVNGWPAWFSRRVGRGTAVFTALGARGWFRPRARNDPRSPYPDFPDLPVPRPELREVAAELQPAGGVPAFDVGSFRPLLAEAVGYRVVGPAAVGAVFGGCLLAGLALGLALRRSRRPELLGWLGPAAALAGAAAFLALGEASRHAVPPTVALGQVVEGVPGQQEAPVRGLLALYRPDSGPAEVGAGRGGFFELDMAGLGGQARRLVLTDLGRWHFEGLSLPAGLRFAPFRATAATAEPLSATASFTPRGLEGKLSAGPFRDPADAILYAPGARHLAARLGPGGAFRAGAEDALPAGQYLPGAVLSDAQQRRQGLYRQFLSSGGLPAGPALLAWAEPAELGFALAPGARPAVGGDAQRRPLGGDGTSGGPPAGTPSGDPHGQRTVGSALLVIPLKLGRASPGQEVTVPGPLVSYRRLLEGRTTPVTREGQGPADMRLRFQLPGQVLPLRVGSARLYAGVRAPGRRLIISGRAGGKRVELLGVDGPAGPLRVDVPEPAVLEPDGGGGLHLDVALSAGSGGFGAGERWAIDYLELEVSGQVEEGPARPDRPAPPAREPAPGRGGRWPGGRGESPTPIWTFNGVIDSPMYQSPELPFPPVEPVLRPPTDLWLKALARPEAELRCQAAGAFAEAYRRGGRGLEAAVAPLLAELERPEQHPTVRLAAAQALVTLEARETAPQLLRQARPGGSDLRQVVEPALARWDYRPARSPWLERLRDPQTTHSDLSLAIRGLSSVGEPKAAGALRELVPSETLSGPLRLEAARALGGLRAGGLEGDARRLIGSARAGLADSLAAAELLRKHTSKEAVVLLQRLARDPEPGVAAPGVARLLEIDPGLVPEPEELLTRADPKLRSLAVEALRRRPTKERVRLLGQRLADHHPDVRRKARRALRALATRGGFREQVVSQATGTLGAPEWRGQEQAAILLARLGHKPSAPRLVELLKSDRPEVFVSAAWALRKLAVPASYPGVMRYAEARQNHLRATAESPGPRYDLYDHQLSQLNQLLGQEKYRPADALLRSFVPRMSRGKGTECRAAAIWALGLLHEDDRKPISELVTAVEMRLNDEPPALPPEALHVRRMAAVTLGRIGAKKALPSLRKHFFHRKPALDPVNNACGWAIERLTGEAMPAPTPVRRRAHVEWFLTPLD